MSSTYNYIIIDDEPKAIELLRQTIMQLYDTLIYAGSFGTWDEALKALRDNVAAIVFMDIVLPQKTAMDILSMAPDFKGELIFVTAHADFALNAFDFAATGYVLKPVREALLVRAIDKAIEHIDQKRAAQTVKSTALQQTRKVGIANQKGIDYIDMHDIIYLEGIKRYTKVITAKNTLLSSYSIGHFKYLLEEKIFYQIHRSYIVNINYIKRYESSGMLILSNEIALPVPKQQRDFFIGDKRSPLNSSQ